MSVQELMTMLNPKNVRFDIGAGGIPNMTADDIAGALGMARLPRSQYCLLRVKYCSDAKLMHELIVHFIDALLSAAKSNKWKKGFNMETLNGLAKLALLNEIDARKCKRCGGTGYLKSVACKVCGGIGSKAEMSGRRRAKICKIDEKAWRNTWAVRYNELLTTVSEWEHQAVKEVAHKLFEAD